MKKLFTTILMVGVAMGSWASYTVTESGDGPNKTITVNYVADGISDINDGFLTDSQKRAKILKLTGDWSNNDLQNAGRIVKLISPENGAGSERRVYLDLSECTKMISKVNGQGEIDWTSDISDFIPNANNPETVTVTGKATESFKYYYSYALNPDGTPQSWATPYEGEVIERDGKFYDNDNNPLVKVPTYLDEKGNALPSNATVNAQTLAYSYSYQINAPFSLAGNDFYNTVGKLSGISFPNHENFTAIPNDVFGTDGCPADLATAIVGDNVMYIGNDVFKPANNKPSKLTSFTFPSALKAIGNEAFHGTKLPEIDLSRCTSLVAIKHEAFEDVATATTVTFPEGRNLTFIGNDAFRKSGITELDMRNCLGITEFQNLNGSYRTFSECNALTRVILPPNLREVPDEDDGLFANSKAINYLEFTGTPEYNGCDLQNGLYIGVKAFTDCTNLQTIKLSKNVSTISEQAFKSAAITEIHIPASVQLIGKHAFNACKNLTQVYFDEFDKTYGNCNGAETLIKGGVSAGGQGQGAFTDCDAITDVWIKTKALLQCENNAFDQMITWGSANALANFATLHFPEENIEQYANIKHKLTPEVVADAGAFHGWLWDHYNSAINTYYNGWYEFLNSGFIDDEEVEYSDIMLRTFSDGNNSYLVPDGLRAYVVSDFKSLNAEDYQVTLRRINIIPAGTGVILYGQPNSKDAAGNPDLVMTPVTYTGDAFGRETEIKNYLVPIFKADGSTTAITPYEPYGTGAPVEYRNFALGRYDNTDYFLLNKNKPTDFDLTTGNYAGFFRMKAENYKSGYAYLRLKAEEYGVANGGEIFVKPDTETKEAEGIYPYYYEIPAASDDPIDVSKTFDGNGNLTEEGKAKNPKAWWNPKPIPNKVPVAHKWDEPSKSWGNRNVAFPGQHGAKFLGEFEEDTDGIVKLIVPGNATANGEFYTIQGVKVTNPTKGVYIQNGKKVIIK